MATITLPNNRSTFAGFTVEDIIDLYSACARLDGYYYTNNNMVFFWLIIRKSINIKNKKIAQVLYIEYSQEDNQDEKCIQNVKTVNFYYSQAKQVRNNQRRPNLPSFSDIISGIYQVRKEKKEDSRGFELKTKINKKEYKVDLGLRKAQNNSLKYNRQATLRLSSININAVPVLVPLKFTKKITEDLPIKLYDGHEETLLNDLSNINSTEIFFIKLITYFSSREDF